MKAVVRLTLEVAVLVAALCVDVRASRASGNDPWCAVVLIGAGDVYWDSQYRSVEECRPNVIAGNRGFCNMNPAWDGWHARNAIAPRKHNKKRHVE
jgi:hypothetical protein